MPWARRRGRPGWRWSSRGASTAAPTRALRARRGGAARLALALAGPLLLALACARLAAPTSGGPGQGLLGAGAAGGPGFVRGLEVGPPPLWAALCVALLAFPVVTLWRLLNDSTEAEQVVPPGTDTRALAALDIGLGLEMLLWATAQVDDTFHNRSVRRYMSDSNIDAVGSGLRARDTMVKRWKVRQCYTTPDEILDTSWHEMKKRGHESRLVARRRSVEELFRSAPLEGGPREDRDSPVELKVERRISLTLSDGGRSVELSDMADTQTVPAVLDRWQMRRLSNASQSAPLLQMRRLSNASEKAVHFDPRAEELLQTRTPEPYGQPVVSESDSNYSLDKASDSSDTDSDSSSEDEPVLTPEPRLWQARVQMKWTCSDEAAWEHSDVWLDGEGKLWCQERPDAPVFPVFKGRVRTRRLRYPQECTKPFCFSAVLEGSQEGELQAVHFATRDAAEADALLGLVAGLRRERWRQELCRAAGRGASIFGMFALMVTLSVINKLLFRMVLVPTHKYVHTLSCSTNLAYLCYSWCAVLLKALWGSREQRGDLRKMVGFAWRHWDLIGSIGCCESVAFTMLPLFIPKLPMAIAPLMSQTLLPISMLLNTVLLSRKYSPVQVAGVVVTVLGIYVASTGGRGGAAVSLGLGELAVPVFGSALAYFFLAASFVFKDVAFVRSSREGYKLDLFVLEGVAAIGQCAALALQWPMNFVLLTDLSPRLYFQEVLDAFFGAAGLMPGLLVLYWFGNILYRLATLRAVRQLSSLATMLANLLSVPLSSLVFCLPLGLPLLGPPEVFSIRLVVSLLLLCAGLVIFNWALVRKACDSLRGSSTNGGNGPP